ncbi:Uma2 family endonuclease [Paenibacillus cremeus]|uniref:Uma2 family endonuclease n=1 Tax=Paenibacillus cremeus TaxID=2163881 RepID=A0A559KIM1_9BACL|nr:Uma2 family endonuclease [Paenibacillus cremeus]TVY11985.1 Uma2 family endonuclease [Paenibacillus cremeus]
MSDKDTKKKPVIKEQQGTYDIPERYEIIGGVRYDFLSSPKVAHQSILGNFYRSIHTTCHLNGKIYLAPLDVHFDEDNIVQPDVIYIANENLGIIRDGYIFGAPDLLVEILSRSTSRRDKTLKKSLYEANGVKEYWLADPHYRMVEQFALVNGTYRLINTLTEEQTLTSPSFSCISIDLSTIFPPEEATD